METQSDQENLLDKQPVLSKEVSTRAILLCVAGALVPGLGHAVLRKWDRALVFFGCICFMFAFGLYLQGELFRPQYDTIFALLKFVADAGSGLLYWISWPSGMGTGDPTAFTYDYGNIFLYVAGLLNMLIVIDVFDIAMGRKK